MTRERKLILIGGMIALVLGALYRFAPDPDALFSAGADLAFQRKQLAKYRRLAAEKESLQAAMPQAARALAQAEAGLLTGATPALAAVEIQNIVSELAGRDGISIQSTRMVSPPKPEPGRPYAAIPVQVTLTAGIDRVSELLHRLETAPRLLRISDLRLRVNDPQKPDILQTVFTVEGFVPAETLEGDKKDARP